RAVHDEEHRPRELARARLGHDAANVLMRHADVAQGLRSRGVYRNVTLARPRAGSVFRAAHESRVRRRIAGRYASRAPKLPRRTGSILNNSQPSTLKSQPVRQVSTVGVTIAES